jgi:hypothetical protein
MQVSDMSLCIGSMRKLFLKAKVTQALKELTDPTLT